MPKRYTFEVVTIILMLTFFIRDRFL